MVVGGSRTDRANWMRPFRIARAVPRAAVNTGSTGTPVTQWRCGRGAPRARSGANNTRGRPRRRRPSTDPSVTPPLGAVARVPWRWPLHSPRRVRRCRQLGALIEAASGESYYDYLRRMIFQPAGMTSTDSLPEAEGAPNRAAGYTRRDGEWVSNVDTLPWRGTAAGGGYSTLGDLLRFAEALESGKLISRTMFTEATARERLHPMGTASLYSEMSRFGTMATTAGHQG